MSIKMYHSNKAKAFVAIAAPSSQGESQCLVIPWSACRSVLGQDTAPQTAPDVVVGTLHGSHHHQCVNVCMM